MSAPAGTTRAHTDLAGAMSDEGLAQLVERLRTILRDPTVEAAHGRAEVLLDTARNEQRRRAAK